MKNLFSERIIKNGAKKHTEALKYFDQAIQINEFEPEFYLKRSEVKMNLKQNKSACNDIDTFKKLGGAFRFQIPQYKCN